MGAEKSISGEFTLISMGQGELLIRHKRTGLGCIILFFCVWLTLWTIICSVFLYLSLAGIETSEGGPVPLWLVLLFWVVDICTAFNLIHLVYCQTSFHLAPASLRVETDLLGFKRHKVVLKGRIKRFVPFYPGGKKEEHNMPGWVLKVEGDRSETLITRLSYESAYWLGRRLSEWAGVEFVAMPEE